jgi:hypothetical protein
MRLGVITLGHVHAEELEPLTRHFEHLEQLVLDISPQTPLADHRAELNRAVDAATADWLLIVREREVVDEPLRESRCVLRPRRASYAFFTGGISSAAASCRCRELWCA